MERNKIDFLIFLNVFLNHIDGKLKGRRWRIIINNMFLLIFPFFNEKNVLKRPIAKGKRKTDSNDGHSDTNCEDIVIFKRTRLFDHKRILS
jgi:hypothetical protein